MKYIENIFHSPQKAINSFILKENIVITTRVNNHISYGFNKDNYFEINDGYYLTTPKMNHECPNIKPIDANSWCKNALIFYDYEGNKRDIVSTLQKSLSNCFQHPPGKHGVSWTQISGEY